MRIREAHKPDADAVIALGRSMHAESPRFRALPFSEPQLRATFDALLESKDAVVYLAEPARGGIVGLLAGGVGSHYFSIARYAYDLALYVVPDWRGSSAAIRLVSRFEAFARERGAQEVVLGVSTGVDTARTLKFYERFGYVIHGGSAVRSL